ncbi:hypothetical protein BKA56DRAFT_673316 [Ilyonectria sp. MPI-CAGE-AT-0026]|nr:hypothetical protein BKA56DRAFT_673316 [Ilyonectria sp. MPI-CAGE-AT-0026]
MEDLVCVTCGRVRSPNAKALDSDGKDIGNLAMINSNDVEFWQYNDTSYPKNPIYSTKSASMPGLLISNVRSDHTHWACGWPLDEDRSMICSAGNPMSSTTCCRCGKPRWEGAEALDNSGNEIGTLTGHWGAEEIWTYN